MGEKTVSPILFLAGDAPAEITVPLVSGAAEKVSGRDSILGAQRIGPLWRIYTKTLEARARLLSQGLSVRGVDIRLYDKSPFLLHDGVSEIPTTRLTIDGVPLTGCEEDLQHLIKKLGINLRSPIMLEKARDPDGKLTKWVTGRRFMWIELPKVSLAPFYMVSGFRARLYYREQTRPQVNCHNCLSPGHVAANCTSDVVCRGCRQPGHRQGDPGCTMPAWRRTAQHDQGNREARGEGSEGEEEIFVEAEGDSTPIRKDDKGEDGQSEVGGEADATESDEEGEEKEDDEEEDEEEEEEGIEKADTTFTLQNSGKKGKGKKNGKKNKRGAKKKKGGEANMASTPQRIGKAEIGGQRFIDEFVKGSTPKGLKRKGDSPTISPTTSSPAPQRSRLNTTGN